MKRILVAYDGGDPARRALDTGIELAKRFEASISVVSVVPMHPGRMPMDPWDDRAVHAQELREAQATPRRARNHRRTDRACWRYRADDRADRRGRRLRYGRGRFARSWCRLSLPAGQRVGACGDTCRCHGRGRPVANSWSPVSDAGPTKTGRQTRWESAVRARSRAIRVPVGNAMHEGSTMVYEIATNHVEPQAIVSIRGRRQQDDLPAFIRAAFRSSWQGCACSGSARPGRRSSSTTSSAPRASMPRCPYRRASQSPQPAGSKVA